MGFFIISFLLFLAIQLDVGIASFYEEEEFEIGFKQTINVHEKDLVTKESEYQEIFLYESDHYGKVLVLDDSLQLTERDASHYNEMLAHVPMMEFLALHYKKTTSPSDEEKRKLKVLVLGGGDGYVVSELLKYSDDIVETIDHVELDKDVIGVSREHFPWAKNLWENERVNLLVIDGAAFIREKIMAKDYYDVIIQDSSDPFVMEEDGSFELRPSNVLFSDEHFQSMFQLLEPRQGVLMFQAETYNIPSNLEEIQKWRKNLIQYGFHQVRYGTISINSYPTGQIGFYVAHTRQTTNSLEKNKGDSTCTDDSITTKDSMDKSSFIDWNIVSDYFQKLEDTTEYYHPRIHRRYVICLPKFNPYSCVIKSYLQSPLFKNLAAQVLLTYLFGLKI